ncbi:thioredoxin family protein [Brevundimonas vesicularis]|uniref:thioredoxin family protein n=1 Tax=Brevundimonas vesicularis TaxID=41276 RepID=UPI0038D4CCE1
MAQACAALALILALAAAVLAGRAPVAQASPADSATLTSQPWSQAAVDTALTQGRPVFVNFTADWCVTCKINERSALSSARTARAIADTNTLYLVADWTRRDDAITAALQSHGRSGVPLYLVHTPGDREPRILPQLLTEGTVIDALKPAAP